MALGRPTTLVLGALLVVAVAGRDQGTYPEALWHADADVDVDVGDSTRFWRKEITSGNLARLSIGGDPAGRYGEVYKAHLSAAEIERGHHRAEWRGAYIDGKQIVFADVLPQERWIGWRSMFGGDVVLDGADNGGNYLQLKGDSSCSGPAVGLTISNNRLSLRTLDGNEDIGGVERLWVDPLLLSDRMGSWHSFVLHVNFSKSSSGYLELWVDGVAQTMSDGTTRFEGPTVCPDDAFVFPKFGVYSMDDGIGTGADHWVESPRIGTSYLAVVPR
jgi:hypothetical protein